MFSMRKELEIFGCEWYCDQDGNGAVVRRAKCKKVCGSMVMMADDVGDVSGSILMMGMKRRKFK